MKLTSSFTNLLLFSAILTDPKLLRELKLKPIAVSQDGTVAYARLSAEELQRLQERAHELGRCGGFKDLGKKFNQPGEVLRNFDLLAQRDLRLSSRFSKGSPKVLMKDSIQSAVSKVETPRVKEVVEWFSAYPTRYSRHVDANVPVEALKARLETLIKAHNPKGDITVELISHQSTPQKSVKVHIPGRTHPEQIIVAGGHLDSINMSGRTQAAPGADDNASGTASVFEALRVLLDEARTERSLDFFFYAGEESGLLGSAEIAAAYKKARKDVVAVVQLDMTLFPGDGAFTLGSMTDFTSPWLRSYFYELNKTYIGAKVVEDKCGYACSDHASWYEQGYPSLMPFEASFDRMNSKLHTDRDRVDSGSNFEHSAMFSKIIVALALDLGNSALRQP